MKLFFDIFPVVLFFAAYEVWGIYVATGVAIAAAIVQIGYLHLRHGKADRMQWLSLGVIVVFGGATLLTHNETFIKWKPTALYWIMGGALLVGQTLLRKNFIQSIIGAQITLPEAVWRKLCWSWIGFFTFMGALNLWVAYTFDTPTWVKFKMFGSLGLMFVFVIAQSFYLSRYMQDSETKDAQP